MFECLEVALLAAKEVKKLIDKVAKHDPDLARQMRKSMGSTVQNTCEGGERTAGDRRHRFSVAKGEAKEVVGCILLAITWEFITADESAPALGYLDRCGAMLFRLMR